MEQALISVIIPAYNAERYIAEAIESVLAQTRRPSEIIVVDDGSTDRTPAAVQRYAATVRHVVQPNAGIGAARNRGVEIARGNLLAFLDADDLWAEDKLAWQSEALQADSQLDMIFGYVQQFLSPELAADIENEICYSATPQPAYSAGTMLIRRESFGRAGFFDTHWQLGEFVDWYLRAMDLGLRDRVLPGVVLRRRLHNSNQGIRKRDARIDYVRIVKASLDRRTKT